jgi:hypothetical protein
VNGSLVVMSKHRPERRYVASPVEEHDRVAWFFHIFYNGGGFGDCSQLHRVGNKWAILPISGMILLENRAKGKSGLFSLH